MGLPGIPMLCHVGRENWKAPKYLPLRLTASGRPPASHQERRIKMSSVIGPV